ncbi:MAG: hypothetical protein D8M57_10525 [Candidatus Scalindua sp. AMX11]|nr:MAG: hypothetical protein DWQ00_03480 [Candidatus Scalindua sp.]RZV75828.1 MAG: hypothetical protein EX341_12310 [Candidatus Scalindua sp. SCAELEC01]TDE64885.1 MAG: hypothetical protein D8M57_10525 [Candidatus Scalindua sp. AMX11]
MIQYQSEERVGNTGEILTYEDLKQMERENVLAALPQTNWKVSGGGGSGTPRVTPHHPGISYQGAWH